MYEFLNNLNLSQEIKDKLISLGADSHVALLSMRQAAQQPFDFYIGEEHIDHVVEQLESLLDEKERLFLAEKFDPQYTLGAQLD